MTNLRKIHYQRIYLFDSYSTETIPQNPLREFLAFIKSSKKKTAVDFSYSGIEDSIHMNLSIKENIILDSIPKSLARFNEEDFLNYLEKVENPYTSQLIQRLGDLNKKASELSSETLQIACLVKSLISKSEYVFFFTPEKFQNAEVLRILKDAINFEVQTKSRNTLIIPSNREAWIDLATHLVEKNENSFFSMTSNPFKSVLTKSENFKTTFDFTLLQKKQSA